MAGWTKILSHPFLQGALMFRIGQFKKLTSFLMIGACFPILGCKGSEPTWSAASRSPDNRMIVTARTIEQSGFGTGFIGTAVYLNWTSGSQPPTEILSFSDGPQKPDGMKVGMHWVTPTHLELTYKGARVIDFQAVKCDGVDISVKELGSE
jgi:hypothetical protein